MADLHLNDRLRIDATLLRFFHRAKHHEHANLKSTSKPAEISFLRKMQTRVTPARRIFSTRAFAATSRPLYRR